MQLPAQSLVFDLGHTLTPQGHGLAWLGLETCVTMLSMVEVGYRGTNERSYFLHYEHIPTMKCSHESSFKTFYDFLSFKYS